MDDNIKKTNNSSDKEKTCKVEYFEENDYLVRVFHGTLCFNEILSSWKYLFEKKILEDKYTGVLNDFREARIEMEIEDFEELLSLFKSNAKIMGRLKIAVIMNSPDNIIFPLLAQRNTPFNIKAFSTLDAAKKWMVHS